jgi:Na+/H+ antiporter NhaD/arsenite permease-like protein
VTPRRSGDYVKRRNLMLLAVAYSASIGGTGVITGTPSNLIILEVKIVKTFSEFYFYSLTV